MAKIRIEIEIDEQTTFVAMRERDDQGRDADGNGAARGTSYLPTERGIEAAVGQVVACMYSRALRRLGALRAAREAAARAPRIEGGDRG